MEFFKTVLFGISGLSMIFWVAVIGLWHVYMFPAIFKGDAFLNLDTKNAFANNNIKESGIISRGALIPSIQGSTGLVDRQKYFRKSLVIADFSPVEKGYGVNRLYTSLLMSLGVMSFIILGYALHSGFTLPA